MIFFDTVGGGVKKVDKKKLKKKRKEIKKTRLVNSIDTDRQRTVEGRADELQRWWQTAANEHRVSLNRPLIMTR